MDAGVAWALEVLDDDRRVNGVEDSFEDAWADSRGKSVRYGAGISLRVLIEDEQRRWPFWRPAIPDYRGSASSSSCVLFGTR